MIGDTKEPCLGRAGRVSEDVCGSAGDEVDYGAHAVDDEDHRSDLEEKALHA
jgi:hypothetical protein